MLDTRPDPLLAIFNACEACFWLILAGLTALRGRVVGLSPLNARVLTVSLMLFGVSDVIEIWSGAWWRPAWLLLIKSGCLVAFFCIGLLVYRSRIRQSKE